MGWNPPKSRPGLTFGDDPVEDGLELGDADLQVLGTGTRGGRSVTAEQ